MRRHRQLPRIDCIQPVIICLLHAANRDLHHASRSEPIIEDITQGIGARGIGRRPTVLVAVRGIAIDSSVL